MRVLQLGKFYAPERGGIETLLRSLCEGLAAHGAEVECVVANRSARTVTENSAGVRLRRVSSYGMAMSTSVAPAYPLSTRRFQADVWHAHVPNPLADIAAMLGSRRTPLILSWHSDIVRQKGALKLYAPLQRAVLRRAQRIVVATPNHIEYSSWLPAFREKCLVIPYGLNLDRFRTTRAMEAAVGKLRAGAQGRAILLNVGRLVGYKGQKFAIEALKGLNAELWLVGTGPLEGELKKIAHDVGVRDRVRFLGDVEDEHLPPYFAACDLFVFPSISPNEAFGLVQVEAMACGKALVACHLKSGVPYVCEDGRNGRLVPPMDSAALAAAIRELLGAPNECRRLGEVGRQRAQSEFSESVMVDRYWTLIQELAGQRRA